MRLHFDYKAMSRCCIKVLLCSPDGEMYRDSYYYKNNRKHFLQTSRQDIFKVVLVQLYSHRPQQRTQQRTQPSCSSKVSALIQKHSLGRQLGPLRADQSEQIRLFRNAAGTKTECWGSAATSQCEKKVCSLSTIMQNSMKVWTSKCG